MVEVTLYVVHIILNGHIYFRQFPTHILIMLEHNAQMAVLSLGEHILPDSEIHDCGNDNHHYQNHRHDVVSEPCRQGFLHIT